ncbi:ankyrin repeat and SOCS box protein 13-like [Nasonia vitripennis]|uniref:Uncharacterized protein n=1 Tax=Nasonia vitripennis TaxID=7425 RepID=A0A7M7HDH3_NASVI|nr:ankyrin repeat and SOCS box protein 13-like [Nasonia vitripennis]
MVELLLKDGGLRINARLVDSDETFLHVAAITSCDSEVPVIRRLVRAGAVVSTPNIRTWSEHRHDWFRPFIECFDGKTFYGEDLRELVKMMLDADADINAKDNDEVSPIQCAVYTSDLELVTALIDAGADVNNRNCNDVTSQLQHRERLSTALHWAVQLNIDNSHKRMIRMLMEFGSNENHANENGETPFHYILQFGDIDMSNLFSRWRSITCPIETD